MSARTTRCYLGLGSNLNDPLQQLQTAFSALATIPLSTVGARSAIYRSPPLYPPSQPDYLNAVIVIDTALTAHQLLRYLQQIETAQGRERAKDRFGPRTLDLDLLLYGDAIISTAQLIVPHPGLLSRNFVLFPLAELAPELRLPSGQLLQEVLLDFSAANLEKISQ